MRLNLNTINWLGTVVEAEDVHHLIRMADRQDYLENKWRGKLDRAWRDITKKAVASLDLHGEVKGIDFEMEKFFVEHAFDIMGNAIQSARRMPRIPGRARLAYAKGPMPRSLADLRLLWDSWRKRREVPVRQRDIVDQVKKAYVKKCQSVWDKHAAEYREGKTGAKLEIIAKVKAAADTEFSRAKMIVETETTRYWNQTRRKIYDQSEDVTHYLFVPVRDYATTPWCFDGTREGATGRGRGNLVYKKGDPLLDTETPPCHWNCRSEMLPLTKHNPRHLTLIEDKSRARRSHKCEPLPPSWNR